MQSIFEGK